MSDPFAFLILGGGPAGLAAARAYREAGGEGAVAIVTDEHRVPYNRPPLSKELLRGESAEDELPIESEAWLGEQSIALVAGRAVRLDTGEHTVTLSGGRRLEYSCCLLATGAEPGRLPIPGADDPAVRVLRTLEHVRELTARLRPGARVAVVGSGFIGCEIAASLRIRGHPVTLISDEPAPNQQRLGVKAAGRIAGWLTEQGVVMHLGGEVDRIIRAGERLEVHSNDLSAPAEIVVMATGVTPRGELAEAAGLDLSGGAIPVAATMRTARQSVLAAGDVCLAENRAAGRALRVEHWGDALRQGEIAGRTAAGHAAEWDSVPGFWSTIGDETLKHAAWGDGFERVRFESHEDGSFTAWYGADQRIVGVLTHGADDDYDAGRELVAAGASWRW